MMNGRMYSWKEWSEAAETTIDLSYEANELGLIPLSCDRLHHKGRKCSAKVFDSPQKRRQGGIGYRRVQCMLCGWESWRKIGLKRG